MLRQRLITGSLLIAGLLGLVWLDDRLAQALQERADQLPGWLDSPRGVLMAVVVVLGLAPLVGAELARMLRGCGVAAPTWLTMLAAVVGAAAQQGELAIVATAAWGILCLALIVHTRRRQIEGVAAATGGTLLAFVYTGLLLGLWLQVYGLAGAWVTAGAILTIKSSDSGAYFTGMALGRHKLIPWLSPGKTWEGLAGGIIAAALVGGALAHWSGSLPNPAEHVPALLGTLGGAILGIAGPFGDLAESLLKRGAGMKDSGGVLPGMGGALDMLDSLLLAGPVVYWLLQAR